MKRLAVELYRNDDGELYRVELTLDTEAANNNGYELGSIFTVNDWPYEAAERLDLDGRTIMILERLG